MKQTTVKHTDLPASPPERDEIRDLPRAPRMIMEISRLLRYRMRHEGMGGVMGQHTARLLMAHLAVNGSLSQLELSQLTHLATPTVSVLLRQMEAEGYILRRRAAEDRRVMRVTLSEQGLAFDREHLRRISSNDKAAMKGLSPEEQEVLVSLLERVRNNLKEE